MVSGIDAVYLIETLQVGSTQAFILYENIYWTLVGCALGLTQYCRSCGRGN